MKNLLWNKGMCENISSQFKGIEKLSEEKFISWLQGYFKTTEKQIIYKGIKIPFDCFISTEKGRLRKLLWISFIERVINGESPQDVVSSLIKGYDELYKEYLTKFSKIFKFIWNCKKEEKNLFFDLTEKNVFIEHEGAYITSIEVNSERINIVFYDYPRDSEFSDKTKDYNEFKLANKILLFEKVIFYLESVIQLPTK